jgi:hypothetical protein
MLVNLVVVGLLLVLVGFALWLGLPLVTTRTVVGMHLLRERFDVLLAVLAPLVLMIESGYANAWVFAGGRLVFDVPSLMALGRGIFLEALIFACYKLVRVFAIRRVWAALPIPLIVGTVGMIVSAGCNLGWMAHSPEMKAAFVVVAALLPGWMGEVFRVGLGLLFPVGVGVFALFDVSHLVEQLIKSSHLDNKALFVVRSELHRTAYLKHQKRQIKEASEQYAEICRADVQHMVDRARSGDLSFGVQELAQSQQTPAKVSRVGPPVAYPPLAGPGGSFGQPAMQGLPSLPGAPGGPMGMPQMAGAAPAPQKGGLLGWLSGK